MNYLSFRHPLPSLIATDTKRLKQITSKIFFIINELHHWIEKITLRKIYLMFKRGRDNPFVIMHLVVFIADNIIIVITIQYSVSSGMKS